MGSVCGRFASTSSVRDLASVFEADVVTTDEREPRYNVAPTTDILVVKAAVTSSGGSALEDVLRRELTTLRWGLVPSWAKDPSVGSKMINARAESIASKPSFRSAFAKRRCLIPVDAFYEWRREGSKRYPFAIARTDRRPMAFAGVWEMWRDRGGSPEDSIRSAAIVTTSGNEVMAPIHDRMPVILEEDTWDTWLDPSSDREELLGLLVPAGPKVIETWRVSDLVNKVANRGAELLDPL